MMFFWIIDLMRVSSQIDNNDVWCFNFLTTDLLIELTRSVSWELIVLAFEDVE